MTNEQNGLGKVIDILIQDARKDERNKVIEGIFDFVFNYDMELHVMNDILAKLNQLKNP